jgi:hypothetical protein
MKTRARILLSSFLLAPLLCSTASGITIVDDGTAVIDSPVDCGAHKGRVVVSTGVHFQEAELDFQDGISLSFQATRAMPCPAAGSSLRGPRPLPPFSPAVPLRRAESTALFRRRAAL